VLKFSGRLGCPRDAKFAKRGGSAGDDRPKLEADMPPILTAGFDGAAFLANADGTNLDCHLQYQVVENCAATDRRWA